MKKSRIVPLLISVIVSSAVFFAIGLLLLPAEIGTGDDPAPVGDSVSGIPYSSPENAALLFTMPDGSGALLYLDFESTVLEVTVYGNHAEEQAEKSRYSVYYKMAGSTAFLASLSDRIGGIELAEGGSKRRYFSAGLGQKLSERLSLSEKKEIAAAFFEKTSKMGLSSEDFTFIIEETDTNLSYPVCFGWLPYIEALAENTVFIE